MELSNYSKIVFPLVLLIVFRFSSAAKSKSPCDFPAVFNFGDSNSDTGGLSAAFGQAGPPAGETYFGAPAGRYCDGRLVIDFIAESLGLPHLSAFLDALGSNFSHGANFATAGSTIRPQNTTLHQSGFSPISLNVQSYEFNDFLRRSQIIRTKGDVFSELMPKEKHFSKGLYTFDIGQNDLTSGYFLNMSTDQVRAYVPDVIDQFKTVIQGIYGRGGRYFWIHNTGPVGCLPYILDRLLITAGQVDKAGCASPFNEVAQYFNTKLKEAVIELRKDLPLAALTYVDVYSVKYELISRANKYGIFNFGDSNSDTGGLSAAFGQAPYPNGETFFHSPAGRFSDGRLLIDFIAEGLNLPYLSAFLDSIGSNFSHGANFATAGSTIRPQNTTMAQSGYSPISLDVQGVQFSDFHTRSQIIHHKGNIFGQLLPKEEDFSQALYTFDIGQNDLTAGYKLNMSTDQVEPYVPDLLSQLSNVIKKIYVKGGRSFWIHNTGPVGCLPYVMDRFMITAAQVDKYGCANPFNEVSKYFNLLLKKTVVQLRKELPLAAITYVDVYSVKYSLIANAKKLGFENPFLACCGHGGKYNYNIFIKCGSKKVVNGKEIVIASSCKDPSVRVSWDGAHFTEAANKWIFDQIVNGSFSDPPIPLHLACNRVNH